MSYLVSIEACLILAGAITWHGARCLWIYLHRPKRMKGTS